MSAVTPSPYLEKIETDLENQKKLGELSIGTLIHIIKRNTSSQNETTLKVFQSFCDKLWEENLKVSSDLKNTATILQTALSDETPLSTFQRVKVRLILEHETKIGKFFFFLPTIFAESWKSFTLYRQNKELLSRQQKFNSSLSQQTSDRETTSYPIQYKHTIAQEVTTFLAPYINGKITPETEKKERGELKEQIKQKQTILASLPDTELERITLSYYVLEGAKFVPGQSPQEKIKNLSGALQHSLRIDFKSMNLTDAEIDFLATWAIKQLSIEKKHLLAKNWRTLLIPITKKGKDDRIAIYVETKKLCEQKVPEGKKLAMQHATTVYTEEKITVAFQKIEQKPKHPFTEISVLNEDSLVTAKLLQQEGLHPLVLNMACRTCPGGGVEEGSGAQEETIFRCSNLHQSLDPKENEFLRRQLDGERYAIPQKGVILTKGVSVLRSWDRGKYSEITPFQVDIVSAAGLCLNPKDPTYQASEIEQYGATIEQQKEFMKTTLRSILQAAVVNGNDSIVLGALGCGAFDTEGSDKNQFIGNNTENFTSALQKLLQEEEFKHAFKNITLAILSFNPEESENPATSQNRIDRLFGYFQGIFSQDTIV